MEADGERGGRTSSHTVSFTRTGAEKVDMRYVLSITVRRCGRDRAPRARGEATISPALHPAGGSSLTRVGRLNA